MSLCDGPGCKCWANGYAAGTRDAMIAVTRSGLVESAATAERLLVEAQAAGLSRPEPEPVAVQRWHE